MRRCRIPGTVAHNRHNRSSKEDLATLVPPQGKVVYDLRAEKPWHSTPSTDDVQDTYTGFSMADYYSTQYDNTKDNLDQLAEAEDADDTNAPLIWNQAGSVNETLTHSLMAQSE